MKINEVEGITVTDVDSDLIYNKIRIYYNWVKAAQDELPLVNAHKESLWQEIDTFQRILKIQTCLL